MPDVGSHRLDRRGRARAGRGAAASACGCEPRLVGTPGEPGETNYDDDLRDARGCLLEAGGQVEDALADGRFPVLTSSDCSICITTLPAVARLRPEALVLWLDAHPDFNDPETTPLGLPGRDVPGGGVRALGRGLRRRPPRPRACRDVRHPRRRRRRARAASRRTASALVERPSRLAELLAEREVFVHLDLDVLDPRVMPGLHWPVDGGFSDGGLRTLLAEVAEAADIVGVEVTDLPAPALARRVATIVEPLLP